jgi:hypothetical protein
MPLPHDFIPPCLPTKAAQPTGEAWLPEIEHVQTKEIKVGSGGSYSDSSGKLEVFGPPSAVIGVDTGATVYMPAPPSLRRSLRARRRALSYLVSRWEA